MVGPTSMSHFASTPKLLTREQFKEQCFARSKGWCIFHPRLEVPCIDAHHIIERRLFPDGGYYLDNAAAVCSACHRACEACTITVEEVRTAANITNIVVPPGYDPTAIYDKWGHKLKKFSRTYHFDWSLSLQNDDRRLQTQEYFENAMEIVVTEKLDGENTTMYHDAIHARSMDSRHHGSRDWVKALHGRIKHDIPSGWRVVVENVYAKHSIFYENLKSYAYGIAVFDEHDVCLAWDDAVDVFSMLGIVPAPVLYRGPFDEALLRKLALEQDGTKVEGYVARTAQAFRDDQYLDHVAKYVRAKHVATDQHWMQAEIVPNKLDPDWAINYLYPDTIKAL